MKTWPFIILLTLLGCGDDRDNEKSRRGEEMQLICQVDHVEKYKTLTIPNWVKKACNDYYLNQIMRA
jgi:hypothetical protein